MSASALRQQNSENLAASLDAFARALFGPRDIWDPTRIQRRTRAVAEAIVASRAAANADNPRAAAYRALMGAFLKTNGDDPSAATCVGARSAKRRLQAPVMGAEATLEALHRLAPLEKAALLLIAVERFSYSEAAAAMDLDVPAFLQALARGREAFAARLASTKAGGRAHLRLVR